MFAPSMYWSQCTSWSKSSKHWSSCCSKIFFYWTCSKKCFRNFEHSLYHYEHTYISKLKVCYNMDTWKSQITYLYCGLTNTNSVRKGAECKGAKKIEEPCRKNDVLPCVAMLCFPTSGIQEGKITRRSAAQTWPRSPQETALFSEEVPEKQSSFDQLVITHQSCNSKQNWKGTSGYRKVCCKSVQNKRPSNRVLILCYYLL